MEWPTFWNAMAVFVAVAAAVFAERAASAAESSAASAQRANDIEMHRERLSIYKALLELHHRLNTQGIALQLGPIGDFYQPSTLSEFYYPEAQFKELTAILGDAFALNEKHHIWLDQKQERNAEAAKTFEDLCEQRKNLDKRIETVKTDLRARLRLDPSYAEM
jgi:hypothetical protein